MTVSETVQRPFKFMKYCTAWPRQQSSSKDFERLSHNASLSCYHEQILTQAIKPKFPQLNISVRFCSDYRDWTVGRLIKLDFVVIFCSCWTNTSIFGCIITILLIIRGLDLSPCHCRILWLFPCKISLLKWFYVSNKNYTNFDEHYLLSWKWLVSY